MKKKITASQMPKPRRVWAINPKTRVTPSKKRALREGAEKTGKDWANELLD